MESQSNDAALFKWDSRRGARELAGHGADEGHYFLIRKSVEPSEELRRQIFPNL